MKNKIESKLYDRKTSFAYFLSLFRYKIDHERVRQKEIAQSIGIRPEYVNRVYKGRQTCSVDVQEKICRYFGVSYLEALALGKHLSEKGELPPANALEPDAKPAVPVRYDRRKTDRMSEADIVSVVSQWAARKKEAEESLAKLQNILENLSEGIVTLDTELNIEYQNRSHRDMFGGNLVGQQCNAAHGCEKYIGQCPSLLSRRTGMPASAVFPYAKGMVSALTTPIRNWAGEVTGYVTVLRDVTEMQNIMTMAEKAFEMLDRAVFVYDEKLDIKFFNSKLKEITGASDGDLATMVTFLKYLKENSVYKEFDKVAAIIEEARKRQEEANIEIHFSTGKKFIYTARPMFTNEGQYIGRMGIFTPFG